MPESGLIDSRVDTSSISKVVRVRVNRHHQIISVYAGVLSPKGIVVIKRDIRVELVKGAKRHWVNRLPKASCAMSLGNADQLDILRWCGFRPTNVAEKHWQFVPCIVANKHHERPLQ